MPIRIVVTTLYGFSISIIIWVSKFVFSKPTSIFRNIELSPLLSIPYFLFGLIVGILLFLYKKRYSESFLILAIVLFIFSISFWYFIQKPILGVLLLPPISGK